MEKVVYVHILVTGSTALRGQNERGGEKQKTLGFILHVLIDWMEGMREGAEAKTTLGFSI